MNSNCRMCFCASGIHFPSQKADFATGSQRRRTGVNSVRPVRRPIVFPGLEGGTWTGAAATWDVAIRLAPPDLPALGLAARVRRVAEALVVLDLQVRELHPDAGQVERVRVRREASVGLDQVAADLLRVVDRLLGGMAGVAHVGLRG